MRLIFYTFYTFYRGALRVKLYQRPFENQTVKIQSIFAVHQKFFLKFLMPVLQVNALRGIEIFLVG